MPNSVEQSPNHLPVSMSPEVHDDRIVRRSMLVLCGFELLLTAMTFPVWHGESEVPRIPLFGFLQRLPAVADSIVLALFCSAILALAAVLTLRRFEGFIRSTATLTLIMATALILTSMHRLQAWHWLLMQCLLVICVLRNSSDRRYVLQKIPAIIYLCSALSRFSPEIDQSMTGQVVSALLKSANLRMAAESPELVYRLAWTFAIGELLIGILLLIPRIQKFGAISAMILHTILLTGLGPLGLNHHAGVLTWNLCFLCLLPVLYNLFSPVRLFRRFWSLPLTAPPTDTSSQEQVIPPNHHLLRRGLTVVLFVFPVSSLFGLADNWPGWQLYSSRPEVWAMFVKQETIPALPKTLQPYVRIARPLDEWCPVRLDRWVLNQTGAPIYPEDRYQSALIFAVTSGLPDGHDLRVEISEPSIFPWWNRQYRIIEGRRARMESLDFPQ
ncbi:MAG: hypothetical protein JNL58_03470 [Planctomyces sp.]|nr:hypothetical protein [Planctomyces sp.]